MNTKSLPDWTGETVAIIGNGPSMTKELLARLQDMPRVAVNRAVAHDPEADMLVSIDGNWPEEGDRFPRVRVVGVECGKDALYMPLPYEIVTLTDGAVVHLRNNALSAMRIAADCGAAKLILAGMDPEAYEARHEFRGFVEGLEALIAELRARGIAVEHLSASGA
jgi:hypothetical protein